jgi:hypothetical protein
MFYCLCKAAKVHSINITSPQRGLAINSYKNVIKTVKICQFYRQNNIMKELVQKTISILENTLIKYQDKFSHEEIFGITPSGEIVNPDGLDLTLSSFGLNSLSMNGLGNSSSIPQIKITTEACSVENVNNMKSANNSNQSIVPQKRNEPSSNQIQQSCSFIQGDNGETQQFVSVPESLFTDTFTQMQQSQMIQSTTSANGQMWELFSETSSYDHITPTSSANQTPSIVSPSTNYLQPQRTQSLPNSTSSQMNLHTLKPITREIFTSSPSSSPISPTLQQSQRYVVTDINDDNVNSFTSENNNDYVILGGNESSLMYDDYNSRISFNYSSSTTPIETTFNIFNNIPTTTPTSSRSRSRSPFSSSSSSSSSSFSEKEKEINALYFDNSNDESSINLLDKMRVTSPTDIDTSIYDTDYDQFESNSVAMIDIGSLRHFEEYV